jgi:hypothetical protein
MKSSLEGTYGILAVSKGIGGLFIDILFADGIDPGFIIIELIMSKALFFR